MYIQNMASHGRDIRRQNIKKVADVSEYSRNIGSQYKSKLRLTEFYGYQTIWLSKLQQKILLNCVGCVGWVTCMYTLTYEKF